MSEPDQSPRLFDPARLEAQRDRAMRRGYVGHGDFLAREIAERVGERVGDTTRRFERAVVAGTGAGAVALALPGAMGRDGTGVAMTDPSPAMLAAAAERLPEAEALGWRGEALPFARGGADLAVSLGLGHWLEDPVGHLVQLRLALKPDGLLIAAFLGGQTLSDLRVALAEAEVEVVGGLSPRVAPMGELRDLGALLQRAGLAMPVADGETVEVSYADAFALMRDLRAMGETNAMAERLRVPTRRAVFARAAERYAARAARADGRVSARFDLVFLPGWSPSPDQPQPLRPGSARTRHADALGTEERPAGEKAGRSCNGAAVPARTGRLSTGRSDAFVAVVGYSPAPP
ncbi:MAG: methyltransferase domain-containing protein [Paracoccaceae bacterium]